MKPLVSVIITTFKGNDNLIRAINSVIKQSYTNVEIIVVDDNNPDSEGRKKTEELMENYLNNDNIIYLKHEKNMNGAAARNTGIKKSKGKYISFLDDDDIYLSNKIEACVEYLKNHKDLNGVYSSVIFMNNYSFYSIQEAIDSKDYMKELMLNTNMLGTGSNIFVEKKCIDILNGFDEQFLRFQDVEFMLRFLEKFKIGYIPEVLIIKDSGDINRRPNYDKIKKMVGLFCGKFENEINSLSETEKKEFYDKMNTMLFNVALQSNDKAYIKETKDNIKKYRKLNIKERILLSFIVRWMIRKIKRKNHLLDYKKYLSEEHYYELLHMGRQINNDKKVNKE